MRTKKYLAQVADKAIWNEVEVYQSKFDGSYITQVGMEKSVRFLADREITEELTQGVGFSPKDNKWYGWSHRAIYGFEVGSTCKKGDCHYNASNEEDEIEAAIAFWSGDNHINVTAKKVKEGKIEVSWEYDNKTPNEKLRGTISGTSWYYNQIFGKGEWVAETLEDAKVMAQDFNEGVN